MSHSNFFCVSYWHVQSAELTINLNTHMRNLFLILMLSFYGVNSFGQKKEILIIGTMHTVSKTVKNSYKPLLKFAKSYKPEAIYVERIRPSDTVSLNYYSKKFIEQSDSLKKVFVLNPDRFESLQKLNLNQFTEDDFEFMAKTYFVNRDYANYYYFNYLKDYGIEGSKKPLRNENADFTSKLAIAMNLKQIFSMDDQQTNAYYHSAWKKCIEIGKKNEDNEINKKLNKRDYNSSIIPAILGRLGKHINKPKSLNRMHLLNSFRYVKNSNSDCANATSYWDERNHRMAKNIAEQVKEYPFQKNIVIVGAGHVIGIKQELEKNYPNLVVKLMYE